MNGNNQLQGARRSHGLVPIGPGYRENQSWQRVDGGGRYAGREYYDRRSPDPDGGPTTTPGAGGRLLLLSGLLMALAGATGLLWLILSFVHSIGSNTVTERAFDLELAQGLPLSTASFLAMVAGGVIAAIGGWLARTARRRQAERLTWDSQRLA